jgi:transmembrane sensor
VRPAMSERRRSRETVDSEASQWLARLRLGLMSKADEASFETWRAAERRHSASFDRMSKTLAEISSLTALGQMEPLNETVMPMVRSFRRAWPLAASVAIAASILLGIVAVPRLLDRLWLGQTTGVAEIRTISLPDGSVITLAPKSRVKIHYQGARREVELVSGEAFFEIAHDTARPFFVRAGDAVVRVVGTKFDVNRGAGNVRVAVLEGLVEVSELPHPELEYSNADVKTLKPGERLELPAKHAASAIARVESVAAFAVPVSAPAGIWREGRLSYDDARLADVVADLNRYYSPGIQLTDELLGERRIAASFRIGETDTFLANLSAALSIAVSRDAKGTIMISPLPGPPR